MSYGDPECTIETLWLEVEQAAECFNAALIDPAGWFEHCLWLETLALDEELELLEEAIAEARFEEDTSAFDAAGLPFDED